MKRDFNAWLASLGPAAPVKTLAELRAFNTAHSNRNAIKYAQVNLDRSDELDLETDRAKWEADRKRDIALAATHGIDAVMKQHKLDALFFPGAGSASIAAKPGYPTVIVPFATDSAATAGECAVPRRLHARARAIWRELHRHGVQRAAADRARLRI